MQPANKQPAIEIVMPWGSETQNPSRRPEPWPLCVTAPRVRRKLSSRAKGLNLRSQCSQAAIEDRMAALGSVRLAGKFRIAAGPATRASDSARKGSSQDQQRIIAKSHLNALLPGSRWGFRVTGHQVVDPLMFSVFMLTENESPSPMVVLGTVTHRTGSAPR